jgi:hypothetical protein
VTKKKEATVLTTPNNPIPPEVWLHMLMIIQRYDLIPVEEEDGDAEEGGDEEGVVLKWTSSKSNGRCLRRDPDNAEDREAE